MPWLTIGAAVARLAQKSKSGTRAVAIPTLRVVENLLRLSKLGIAGDVGRVRDDLLRKSSAEADIKAAEARQRVVDAVEAENRSQLSTQRAQVELRKELAEATKQEAEARQKMALARIAEAQANAIERAFDEIDEESMAKAAERFKRACRRISAKGGQVGVDEEELIVLQRQLTEAAKIDVTDSAIDVVVPSKNDEVQGS